VLQRAALPPDVRPETLDVRAFVTLLAALVDAGWVGD
jgi:hypothetical protein